VFDHDKFAALLCDWCLEAQAGQRIVVAAPTTAEPLISAVHGALLKREVWPFLLIQTADQNEQRVEHAQEIHLDSEDPMLAALFETMDASLRIGAPTNTRGLSEADPARLGRLMKANAGLQQRLLAKRWALTLWPTPALAQEANMSLAAYERFVTRALFLDRPDPIVAWQELSARQQQLVERLSSARTVRIQSERTDLTLDVTGRTWINSDGKRNMPSGEVFTSPHEASATGQIFFDIPSNHNGTTVSGVALTLVDGVVTEARADQGDERLQAELATDPGARRLGEVGIGTNDGIDRQTGSTLMDEKIGGTLHLALGRSYAECGGVNASAIHWDIVCDLRQGGEIAVDGEVLSRDGQFV
jgi:aminopeptidase